MTKDNYYYKTTCSHCKEVNNNAVFPCNDPKETALEHDGETCKNCNVGILTVILPLQDELTNKIVDTILNECIPTETRYHLDELEIDEMEAMEKIDFRQPVLQELLKRLQN